jgi:hypothetical protein
MWEGAAMPEPIMIDKEDGWLTIQHLEFDEAEMKLKGKYLIFSPNVETLVGIAIKEITEHNFGVAKVSIESKGKDHVLCLYWKDDSRKGELADRYKQRHDVAYRWWKSDADTRAGKYSKQFKTAVFCGERELDPDEQPDNIDELPMKEDMDFGNSLDLGCKD